MNDPHVMVKGLTKRTVRITVSCFKTSSQNYGNESTSVMFNLDNQSALLDRYTGFSLQPCLFYDEQSIPSKSTFHASPSRV